MQPYNFATPPIYTVVYGKAVRLQFIVTVGMPTEIGGSYSVGLPRLASQSSGSSSLINSSDSWFVLSKNNTLLNFVHLPTDIGRAGGHVGYH